MSKLNLGFGLGFVGSVALVFFIGEHPEWRPAASSATAVQAGALPGAGPGNAAGPLAHHADYTTNDTAIDIIKQFEGLSLKAYPEADYWLIGYGHKGPNIHEGMSITAQQAERYLRTDLRDREAIICSLATVALSENEFSALVILTYNIGAGSFRNSTVLRLLNENDRQGAADAFLMWNKVKRNGQLVESSQLTRRRQAERALFLASD